MSTSQSVDVVIVGGGPVGMLLAAELVQRGLEVVLVETRTEVDDRPRAGTVHARSLSHLARRGYIPSVAPEEIGRAGGQIRSATFQFAGFPNLTLTVPAVEPAPLAGIDQAVLEASFERRARALGADIRRGTTAQAIIAKESEVQVQLLSVTDENSESDVTARFCVGADGARSLVASAGAFPVVEVPATMSAISGLARSGMEGPPPGWNQTAEGWTMHNPNPTGKGRVIGMEFRGPITERSAPTEKEYRAKMTAVLGRAPDLSSISHLTRFSDYSRYRSVMRYGRLLVIGDAAHIHYPLGGQGLNTGIQDAFTLGWRLVDVIQGRATEEILNTWSDQRVAVAAVVVGNTVLQSRMMNPAMVDLRDAVQSMLTVPAIHDSFAAMISGQFQPGFVGDVAITDESSRVTTSLARGCCTPDVT